MVDPYPKQSSQVTGRRKRRGIICRVAWVTRLLMKREECFLDQFLAPILSQPPILDAELVHSFAADSPLVFNALSFSSQGMAYVARKWWLRSICAIRSASEPCWNTALISSFNRSQSWLVAQRRDGFPAFNMFSQDRQQCHHANHMTSSTTLGLYQESGPSNAGCTEVGLSRLARFGLLHQVRIWLVRYSLWRQCSIHRQFKHGTQRSVMRRPRPVLFLQPVKYESCPHFQASTKFCPVLAR